MDKGHPRQTWWNGCKEDMKSFGLSQGDARIQNI